MTEEQLRADFEAYLERGVPSQAPPEQRIAVRVGFGIGKRLGYDEGWTEGFEAAFEEIA